MVLPGTIPDEALKIAHSLQEAASKFAIGPPMERFDVSISCGVSSLVPMPDGLARAIAAAELACKAAKTRGRDRVELYVFEDSSMMRRHADMLAVGQLRSALKSDRLLLFAQRITPLQNPGLAGGYELLLRLRDTDGSLLSPGPLIDAAQRYQLLPTVDRWVVKQALQMLGPYRAMLASRGLTISVNVSGQSIGDETFIQHFTQLLKSANLPKACISVELTEQAAITNLPSAKSMVTRLGALGCGFALDDFGTGANSLTYLKALNVDRVKIDGSFVRDVLSDRNSQATVRAIVFRHRHNLPADCQRRRGRRTGRVDHVQRVGAGNQPEILNQVALRRNRLRAHSRAARRQIARPDLRHQPLQRQAEQLPAERPPQLVPAHRRIFPQEAPQPAVAQGVEQIARVEVGLAVAFPRQCQHRVRARPPRRRGSAA